MADYLDTLKEIGRPVHGALPTPHVETIQQLWPEVVAVVEYLDTHVPALCLAQTVRTTFGEHRGPACGTCLACTADTVLGPLERKVHELVA